MISAILLIPTKLYTAAQKYPFKMDKQASNINPAIISKLYTTRPLRQFNSWWRHQMETFSALLALCAGNSPVPGEFPTQRPVTRSFDVSV